MVVSVLSYKYIILVYIRTYVYVCSQAIMHMGALIIANYSYCMSLASCLGFSLLNLFFSCFVAIVLLASVVRMLQQHIHTHRCLQYTRTLSKTLIKILEQVLRDNPLCHNNKPLVPSILVQLCIVVEDYITIYTYYVLVYTHVVILDSRRVVLAKTLVFSSTYVTC